MTEMYIFIIIIVMLRGKMSTESSPQPTEEQCGFPSLRLKKTTDQVFWNRVVMVDVWDALWEKSSVITPVFIGLLFKKKKRVDR